MNAHYQHHYQQSNKQNDNYPNKMLSGKQNLMEKHRPSLSMIGIVHHQQKKQSLVSKFLKKDNLPEILKKTYSDQIVQLYSSEVFADFIEQSPSLQGFLKVHQITANLRAKMIDWIIQVLQSYKMTTQAFFKCVWIMDNYFKKCINKKSIRQLHLIGITCIFISCKYQQVQPLKLSTLIDPICRNKFTRTQIFNMEADILLTLGFSLEGINIFDISSFFYQLLSPFLSVKIVKYLYQVIIYLSKMSLFEYQLAQLNQTHLGIATFFIALKTVQQVDNSIEPENKLSQICKKLEIDEQLILVISGKVLNLAKNYSKFYPDLTNLKKFNRFEFKQE